MRFLFAYYLQTRDSDVQAVATANAKVPNDHASTPERYGTCPKFISPTAGYARGTYRLFIAPLLGNFRSLARRREIRPIHYIYMYIFGFPSVGKKRYLQTFEGYF